MSFWDASALVPLVVEERTSDVLRALLRQESELAVWWAAPVECLSALARQRRAGRLQGPALAAAHQELQSLRERWTEVLPSDELRAIAERLLDTHALRAADAFQLAAARILASDNPGSLRFVCQDERLMAAAQEEGFAILP